MQKTVLAYLLTVLIFGAGIYATIHAGKKLEAGKFSTTAMAKVESISIHPVAMLRENLRDPLSRLLLQIILIVLVARIFGALAVRLGQPAVIGEMIAGIVLGPSLVGLLFPDMFHGAVFLTDSSLGILRMLSQVGVILFMFIVGMELDITHLRNKAGVAIIVSHVSIFFLFFLAWCWFSFFIYRAFAPDNASFLAFALFMGTAMSLTAFPVLARAFLRNAT